VNRASEQKQLTQLREILATRFNESELRTLCFDLDVEYDDLPGEGISDKARELVAYLERHGRISELVTIVQQKRPDVSLNGLFEATAEVPSALMLPPKCSPNTSEPLLLVRLGPEGPVRLVLEDVIEAQSNATCEEILHLCNAAVECAKSFGDQAELALAYLYQAKAQAQNNRLETGIKLAERAIEILEMWGERHSGDHNVMVAHLLLACMQASQDTNNARKEYRKALDLCRKLEAEKKPLRTEEAQFYGHIGKEIQDALNDVNRVITEKYTRKCSLNSIPILQLSDGPEVLFKPSGVINYIATGEFKIEGSRYFLYPVDETVHALELQTGAVHFALRVPEEGWLGLFGNEQDYALVRQEAKITSEGPAVLWTEERWIAGRFERDVTTGRIEFAAPELDVRVIGKEQGKVQGRVVGLLRPIT